MVEALSRFSSCAAAEVLRPCVPHPLLDSTLTRWRVQVQVQVSGLGDDRGGDLWDLTSTAAFIINQIISHSWYIIATTEQRDV